MKPKTITGQIEEIAFKLLRIHPEGISWTELNTLIKKTEPSFHPKTINGTLWKLNQKYPDKISKKDGLFRLVK